MGNKIGFHTVDVITRGLYPDVLPRLYSDQRSSDESSILEKLLLKLRFNSQSLGFEIKVSEGLFCFGFILFLRRGIDD